MNKNILALAVAAAAFSGAVSAAQVYSDDTSSLAIGGRVEARAQGLDGDVQDTSRVRINIAGQTQINDDLYGLGFFEREFKTNQSGTAAGENNDYNGADGESSYNRYLFAGIGSKTYGQLVFGKADGALGMLTDFTDIMEYYGNEAGAKIAAADRTSNNLLYTGSFGGLTVKANYVANGKADESDVNTTGYSFATKYDFNNGLAMGIGYGQQKNQGSNLAQDLNANQTFASASYTMGNLYFAGLYQYARNVGYLYSYDDQKNNDYQGFSLATAYTLNQLVLRSTYNYMEKTTDANVKMANALDFDASYFFTPNFRVYAGYTINLLDKADATKINSAPEAYQYDDQYALGARYDF
ncbi:porin [Photobacterium damselae subsp. damselae]|uniref:porin n=1 Tax=Photobacterium damselae TaxID=38293 RepID=UPI0010FEEDFE|nr:porin [Photobacterium damselae]TLS83603.1 porin [Photobacterium damselae subsp. damselae]TLS90916.1 porin [Photobacterium damselae subsp. damselae]